MGHTRTQYLDRIRNRLGDLNIIQHLAAAPFDLALEEALATYTKDQARYASFTATGDGSAYTYDLTADADQPWVPGFSRVVDVEHPTGNRRRTMVDSRGYAERDGTVTLLDVTPASGAGLLIRYTTTWPHPDDDAATDLIPDVHFPAVTALAAAQLARGKAVEFARRQSNSVAGTAVTLDPQPLFDAARHLEKVYTDTVLGRSDTAGGGTSSGVAMAVSDMDIFEHTLFHRRDQARD